MNEVLNFEEKKIERTTKENVESESANTLTYFETCSGIGVTSLVLRRIARRLGINVKCVGYSEIDKMAIKMYQALNNENNAINYGDLTQIDWSEIDCDILSFTFPCTAISSVGNNEGFEENVNTTSSLVWELKKILNTMPRKPKIIFMENVAAILNKRHRPTFDKLVKYLQSEGYFVRYEKIDASHHGVPQHRERVYIICTYGEDIDFSFPTKEPLKTKLCDVLEKDVDEKYNLKGLKEYFIKHSMETSYTFRVHNPSYCEKAYTLTTRSGSRISDNYIFEKDLTNDKVIRIKPKNLEMANLSIEDIENTKIRKLTPNEVMTLMGLNEDEREKLKDFKDTTIYKAMGNAIVVDVLEKIFYEYFKVYLGQVDVNKNAI